MPFPDYELFAAPATWDDDILCGLDSGVVTICVASDYPSAYPATGSFKTAGYYNGKPYATRSRLGPVQVSDGFNAATVIYDKSFPASLRWTVFDTLNYTINGVPGSADIARAWGFDYLDESNQLQTYQTVPGVGFWSLVDVPNYLNRYELKINCDGIGCDAPGDLVPLC